MLKSIDFFDVLQETLVKLDGKGTLLVAGDPPNPMTIGWGTIGPIWSKTIFTVLVRPTRHTYNLMEISQDFSVCVLSDQYKKELAFCGSRSGRDTDKIAACGFTMQRCSLANSWFIAESDFHFECRIVHKHRLDPATLDPAIVKRYYPLSDFHTVYYGEVLGVFRKG
jgi:flavin reductase (DIM6/NTAB) family NADH-FMN oxidoreductase RutF